MASGGYTAGIAKITIRPDLSKFKAELEAQISKMLHDRVLGIRANLENEGRLEQSLETLTRERDVTIKTDVDQAAKRKAEADLKPLSKDIAPEVAPEVDKAAVAKVEKTKAELAEDIAPEVAPEVDKSAVAKVEKVKTDLAETVTPEVAPEIDKAAAAQTKAQVEAVAEDQRAVITPDLDNAAAKAVDTKLDEIAKDRDPVITPKVDKKAAEKALKSLDQRAMAAQQASELRRNPKSKFQPEPLSELKETVDHYQKQVADEIKRIEGLGKGKKGFKDLYAEYRGLLEKLESAKAEPAISGRGKVTRLSAERDILANEAEQKYGVNIYAEDKARRAPRAERAREAQQAVRAREGAITQFRTADENNAKLEAQRAAKAAAEAAKEEAKRAADRERIARLAREKEASEKAAAERKEMLKARLARIVAAGQAKQDRERAEYAESRRSRATERLERLRALNAPAAPAKPAQAPVARKTDDEIDGLIRSTYDDLAKSQGSYVRLSRLRDKLNDLTREEIDASLIRLRRSQAASVIPEENQKTLTQQDRDDAVTIGNQANHLLAFDTPKPQPPVSPEPKKAVTTPPPAVAEKPVKVEQVEESEADAARRIEREEKLAERIASRKVGVTNAAKQAADEEPKADDKVAQKVADSVDDLSESTEDLLKKTTTKLTAPTPAAPKAKRGTKTAILAEPIPENPTDAIHLLNKKLGYLTKDLKAAQEALPERQARVKERGQALADAVAAQQKNALARAEKKPVSTTAAADEEAVKKAKSAASSANTSVKNTEKKLGTLGNDIAQYKTLLAISTEALEASQKADAERARESRIEAGKRKTDDTKVSVDNDKVIDTSAARPDGPFDPFTYRKENGKDALRKVLATYDFEGLRQLIADEEIDSSGSSKKVNSFKNLVDWTVNQVDRLATKGDVFRRGASRGFMEPKADTTPDSDFDFDPFEEHRKTGDDGLGDRLRKLNADQLRAIAEKYTTLTKEFTKDLSADSLVDEIGVNVEEAEDARKLARQKKRMAEQAQVAPVVPPGGRVITGAPVQNPKPESSTYQTKADEVYDRMRNRQARKDRERAIRAGVAPTVVESPEFVDDESDEGQAILARSEAATKAREAEHAQEIAAHKAALEKQIARNEQAGKEAWAQRQKDEELFNRAIIKEMASAEESGTRVDFDKFRTQFFKDLNEQRAPKSDTPPPAPPAPPALPVTGGGDDDDRDRYDIEASRRLQAQRRRQRDKERAERRELAADRERKALEAREQQAIEAREQKALPAAKPASPAYDIEATRRLQAQRRRQRDRDRAARREQAALAATPAPMDYASPIGPMPETADERAARWVQERLDRQAASAARNQARQAKKAAAAQAAAATPPAAPTAPRRASGTSTTPPTITVAPTPSQGSNATTVGQMRNGSTKNAKTALPRPGANAGVDAFEKWAKSVVNANNKGLQGNRQAKDTRDKFIEFAREADTSARSVTRFERDAADAVDRLNIALRRQAEVQLDGAATARERADADTEVNAAQRDQVETAKDLAKAQRENDRARRNAFGFEQAYYRDLKAQNRIQLRRTRSQAKAENDARVANEKMGATNYQIATQAADDLGAKRRPATASRKVGDASTLSAFDLDVANEYIAAAKQMDIADTNRRKAIDAVQQATIKLASVEEDIRNQRKNGDADAKSALALEARRQAAESALFNTLERQRQANAELGGARGRFTPAKAAFDDRNDAGPLKRLGQALGNMGSGILDQVNEKILLMGRQLSAVSAIARFAAMGLAGLGAVNLVPVIASLSQMANIGALLPAVFTAAGAALGAVVIGSFGIGDAFKAATKMSDNAGKDAKDKARDQAQAAKSERNARRSLENAQRSQEKAAVSGAKSIVNAEKSVAQAQKQSVNAQKNLSDARETAIDKIADLNDALRGNALDEEGAAQAIERAREAYGRTLQDPEANSLDRREADLNIRQAVENFEQIKKRNREAVVEAREATKAGVEGDEQVIAAKEGIVEANQGVADAEESLAQARVDAAESNADAARSVADAQESLNEVLSTNAEKMNEASTAATEYDEAMAKLAPSARAFVEQMRAMGASWTDLRMLVQENLFKNLGDSITTLAEKQLPNLKNGLAGIASELNGGVRDSIGVLSTSGARDYSKTGTLTPNAQEDFRRFLANTTSATGTAADAMAPLTQAFIDLSTVGSDRLPRMARAIEDVATKFRDLVGEARASGRLDEIMDSGIEKTKQFGRITADVFVSIRRVFQAIRGDGDDMLTVFERGTERMRNFLSSAEGQGKTADFFAKVRESFDRLMTIVGDVASVLVTQVFPAFSTIASYVGPVIEVIANCARAILEFEDALKIALTAFLAFKVIGTLSGIARGVQGAIDTLRIRTMLLSDTMARQTGTTALSRALGGVSTAATGMIAQKGGIAGLLSMFGGPWVIGLAAAAGAVYGIVSSLNNLEEKSKLNEQLMAKRAERMKSYSRDLRDALNASNGVANESVLGKVAENFDAEMDDLEKKAGNRASFWEKFSENITNISWTPGEEVTPMANQMERDADAAQASLDRINTIRSEWTSKDWANAITSTSGEYEQLLNDLKAMGPSADEAVRSLEGQRTAFLESKDGASEFAAQLEKVERKQLDVVSATDALNSANARTRGEALLMEDAQAQATESITRFRSLINGEGFNWMGLINTQGEIDKTTDSGVQLYSQVKSLQTAFDDATNSAYVNAKNNGAGVEQAAQAALDAGAKFRDQLIAQTNGSDDAIRSVDALLGRYGMTPTDIATRFDVDIDPATGKVQTLVDGINGTTASIKVNIDQGEVDDAIAMFGVGSPEAIAAAGLGPTAQGQANWDYRKENGLELSTAPVDGAPVVEEPNAPAVIDAQLPPKMQAIQAQWKTFVDSIAVEYAERIAPALDGIVQKIATINEVLAGSVEPINANMTTLGDLFAALQDRVDKSVTKSIIPAWQKLSPMIMTDALTLSTTAFPMIETALDGLVLKFADTAKGISEAWANIKRGIADPVNWVIDTVINTGLKNAWNGVRGTIPSLPEWTSTAERISGYHRGGIMSGYTPGRDDRVIAVGGGEAVMRPEFTRGMGPEWINNMNRVARTSGVQGVKNAAASFAGNFNTGGIVGAMTSAVQEKFPGMSMTSGLRYTDNGYHSKGMAADFSDGGSEGTAGMRSLAGWIADNFGPPKTLQLIHRPFDRNIGQGVGWVGSGEGFYGDATMEGHRDHVHWATDRLVDANGTTAPGPVGISGGAFSQAASGKISELFTKPVAALKDSMPDFGPTLFGGSMPREFMQSMIDAASKAVGGARNAGGSSLDAGTTPFDISAGVEQWDANIRAALAREGFEVNDRNVQLTKAQMQTESGGNPNAIQQVIDVNSGGNEAVGAMQVVPGTFATHRNPDLPNDRTNIDSSLSAALRYYRATYGDDLGTYWGQGHGYDQGGVFENGTVGWNTSGKPEAVFTNDQWMKIDQLIEALTRPDIYDALTNGTGRVALQASDAGVASQDVATLGETAGELTESSDNLLAYQDGQAAAVEGQVLNAEGVPTNFRPEDSYNGSTAPITPEEKSGYGMTPFMKALTGLGSALVRPDTGQRLSDPYYYNKLQQYAKDRNAQSDAAFAAGNDELGRALSDFDPGMGYAPGTQAQLATMGTQEEQFAQWQTTTAKSFESYFRDNWQGMLGSVVAGAGGATYNIGSIQTNSWENAQRKLNRSARRNSRANSRAGGR